ncbi:hypothetical protein BO98_02650 [Candidatus Synechococcus spongiarum LMB bulk10D]|nr:hypothetical protein BO98_02650 [Candidatus Synechococcus spongiarum LMB bulk10D]
MNIPVKIRSFCAVALACTVAAATAEEASVGGGLSLRMRGGPGAATLVLKGIGPQVRSQVQSVAGGAWRITLTGLEHPVRTQQLHLQQAPMTQVRLSPDPQQNDVGQLTVKAAPGRILPTPRLVNTGDRLMVQFPGTTVGQQVAAPPVGSMAVNNIPLPGPTFIPLRSTQPITMTARSARAQDVLMGLLQGTGYNFTFLDGRQESAMEPRVTVDFRDESLEKAVHFVLLGSGLEGYLEGRTLVVGPDLPSRHLRAKVSRVIRLNQVDAAGAAGFLANLGAVMSVTHSVTTTATEVLAADQGASTVADAGHGNQVARTTVTASVSEFGGQHGPLRGLRGTTDERLNTIAVVGPEDLVDLAQAYLRQMDRRKRQVAVKVRIMNVDLSRNEAVDHSFSARIGNVFLISQPGEALLNFGVSKSAELLGTASPEAKGSGDSRQSGLHDPSRSFYSNLEAAIVSSDVNLLAEPTLLVQEGESASINTTTSVITGNTTTTSPSGITQTSQEREQAGLSLTVDVSKIDDNGFISLKVSPKVSVPAPVGIQNGVPIFNITERALSSGSVRLRDGQTLILSGVIQDSDRQQVSKLPLLGDLPLLGNLFRGSSTTRDKTELIILVTPSLVQDDQPLALQAPSLDQESR